MSDERGDGSGRRRRARRVGEVRKKRYSVYVSPEEKVRLEARAILAGGIGVPQLLFEAALTSQTETSSERKDAIVELYKLRRDLVGVVTNMNQLAKFANTEKAFPEEALRVTAEYRELVPRIQAAVDRLAGR